MSRTSGSCTNSHRSGPRAFPIFVEDPVVLGEQISQPPVSPPSPCRRPGRPAKALFRSDFVGTVT